MNISSHWTQ